MNSDTVLPDFPGWLREQQVQREFPIEDYPGLFHYQAGVKSSGGGFWRKLRKLILKPGHFFQDMLLKRKNRGQKTGVKS